MRHHPNATSSSRCWPPPRPNPTGPLHRRDAALGLALRAAGQHGGGAVAPQTLHARAAGRRVHRVGSPRPGAQGGLTFDDELVRCLVHDTGSGEALPLLAYTLARLVEGHANDASVGLERYRQIGGVRGALQSQAERALQSVIDALADTDSAATQERIFDTLLGFVTLDDNGRPSRRRRLRADLDADTTRIVDAFVDARLLTSDATDEGTLIGVAHEALFSAWPRLAQAIDGAAGTTTKSLVQPRLDSSLGAVAGRAALALRAAGAPRLCDPVGSHRCSSGQVGGRPISHTSLMAQRRSSWKIARSWCFSPYRHDWWPGRAHSLIGDSMIDWPRR